MAKKTFALNTDPHVADIAGTELLFQPEFMGGDFMDAYAELRDAQQSSGVDIDDLAGVAPSPLRAVPEGCLYCRMVVDLGLCDRPSVGMISDRGSATALPDLLSTTGLLPVAGPLDRREQRRDPCSSS
ncbi:hypothetical protein ACWDSL_14805 [Streptomyces sp. NPDC000941]